MHLKCICNEVCTPFAICGSSINPVLWRARDRGVDRVALITSTPRNKQRSRRLISLLATTCHAESIRTVTL